MPGLLPTADHLSHLLRLLDDDTPEIRASVTAALEVFRGDVSEMLGQTRTRPGSGELATLSALLRPARRQRLRSEWIVPVHGAAALDDDWEGVEALLRTLSDFLHDGVTLRQPLPDALDLLAEESAPAYERGGGIGLCRQLFAAGGLSVDMTASPEQLPEQMDLAAAIAGGSTHSLGAGLIAILVGRRLGADIHGINLPGSFLLRAEEPGSPVILDPGKRAAAVDPEKLQFRIRRRSRKVREAIHRPATAGELLVRAIEEAAVSLALNGRDHDAQLVEDLLGTLVEPGH